MPCPCGKKHPSLARPISVDRLTAEFGRVAAKAGIAGWRVVIDPNLSLTHRRNHRRYAQCLPTEHQFEFAPETCWLPQEHRLGLIAHELGHALVQGPGEARADRAAYQKLGVLIRYDRRFPGKGLQYASDNLDRRR